MKIRTCACLVPQRLSDYVDLSIVYAFKGRYLEAKICYLNNCKNFKPDTLTVVNAYLMFL